MIYIKCNAAGLNDPEPKKPFLHIGEVVTVSGSQWQLNLCPKNREEAEILAELFRDVSDKLQSNWAKYDELIAEMEVANANS